MSKKLKELDILKVSSGLTITQIQKFFASTPPSKIKYRPAKGGGRWDYVSGSYVTQVLNSLFGFNWSFEIVTSMQEALATAKSGTVVVQGRLKVKIGDEWITKEQYGRKEVTYKKDSTDLLDFGNDMKAAATDAKKKCASELGLFADVYAQEDFYEAEIVEVRDNDIIEDIQSASTAQELSEVLSKYTPAVQKEFAKLATKRLRELSHDS